MQGEIIFVNIAAGEYLKYLNDETTHTNDFFDWGFVGAHSCPFDSRHIFTEPYN